MLDSLITSKTRIKLLLKFFSNAETQAYLRGLADELGESTNAVRVELNRLSQAGLLDSASNGRTKLYRANTSHNLFPELQSLVQKYLGIDKVIEIVRKLGSVELALITGDYAAGKDTGIIDLVIVGTIEQRYLLHLVKRTEKIIKRKLRVLVLSRAEFENLKDNFNTEQALVVWKNDAEARNAENEPEATPTETPES